VAHRFFLSHVRDLKSLSVARICLKVPTLRTRISCTRHRETYQARWRWSRASDSSLRNWTTRAPAATNTWMERGDSRTLRRLCQTRRCQLVKELRHGHSKTHEITKGATQHGHDLLLQGFTVSQVVHGYGDVCQSVTDLAVEMDAPISTDDFRTLNRCLDDAIAGAVTEYACEQDVTRDGESQELRNLTYTALTAFEVLQRGSVGVGGSTGAVVHRSLMRIRALVDRPPEAETPQGKVACATRVR
jgi:hypothetical protein